MEFYCDLQFCPHQLLKWDNLDGDYCTAFCFSDFALILHTPCGELGSMPTSLDFINVLNIK